MEFRRDQLTWTAYTLLAWYAYLQASPGLVIGHLRDELDLGYTAGGLHVAAFAVGSVVAGITAGAIERRIGRRALFWGSALGMALGTLGLVAGRAAGVTIASTFAMGALGGLLLVTIQAALADRHGERRAVALTEANVAAAVAYAVLIGALSLAAATELGWRAALVASMALPLLAFARSRRVSFAAAPRSSSPLSEHTGGRLPDGFRLAAAVLFCCTAAEWCITAWGASFISAAADVSVDTGVTLMIGYFGGVVVGRAVGSRLTRRHEPRRLLAFALALTAAGFAVLWPSTAPAPAVAGLAMLGLGLGNLFPLALSVTVALAPERAQLLSGRAVVTTGIAVLLAPLTVGALADATSLTAALAVVPIALLLAAAALTGLRAVAPATA